MRLSPSGASSIVEGRVAVFVVAGDRMTAVRRMHADLVGATGMEVASSSEARAP